MVHLDGAAKRSRCESTGHRSSIVTLLSRILAAQRHHGLRRRGVVAAASVAVVDPTPSAVSLQAVTPSVEGGVEGPVLQTPRDAPSFVIATAARLRMVQRTAAAHLRAVKVAARPVCGFPVTGPCNTFVSGGQTTVTLPRFAVAAAEAVTGTQRIRHHETCPGAGVRRGGLWAGVGYSPTAAGAAATRP